MKYYAVIVEDMDPFEGTYKQCLHFARNYVHRPWVLEDPEQRVVARYNPLGI